MLTWQAGNWLLALVAALAGFAIAWWRRGAALERLKQQLQSENDQLNSLGNAQVNTIREITQEAVRLRDRIAAMESNRPEPSAALEQAVAAAREQALQEAEAREALKDEEIQRLRRSVEQVQDSLSAVIREKEGSVAQLRARVDELEPLRIRVRELEQTRARQQEIHSLLVADRERDIELLQRRVQELSEAQQTSLAARDAEIERLRAELEQWRGRAQELETGQAGREAQLLSHIRERESSLEDLRRRAIAFEAEAQALLRNQQQQIEQQQRLLEQMPGRERSDWEAQASALRARHKLEIQEKDAELERLRAAASEAEAGRDRAAGEAAHIVGWIQQAKAQFEQERRELLQLLDAARREAEHLRHQLDVLQARSSAATEAASAEASGDGHGAHPRALAAPWPPPSPGAPPFDLPKALQLAEYEVRALQRQMTDYEEALRERDRMIARLRGEREPHPRLY